jgi:hypothetical protein
MLKMNIRFDAAQIAKAFGELQQEHPNVMAQAINDTTREVRDAQVAEIRASFDNPTAFTLRALRTTFASRSKLQAMVWLKDGTSRAHYLIPQIEGGNRPLKRFEEILVQAGLMRKNERAVPGAAAKLDAYGNMGRGQIVQILSQLQAFNLAGSDANATNSKRSKAKRSKVEYFVAHGGESRQGRGSWKHGDKMQHLRRGVWARYRFSAGSAVKPVLLFVNGTRYGKRFDFVGTAQRVIDARFKSHYEQRMQRQLAKLGLAAGGQGA